MFLTRLHQKWTTTLIRIFLEEILESISRRLKGALFHLFFPIILIK